MTRFTESAIETAALAWLEGLGGSRSSARPSLRVRQGECQRV
jgi:hypothetical protein